jgi:adenylate kinase
LIPSAAKPLRVVLLGPPASGKGTQGKRLAASLGLHYLSTGALLREQVEKKSDLGLRAMPILARGEYLPDDLMCPILADWLSRHPGGWVLDGFPRSLPQATFLADWLAAHGTTLDAAVALDVPIETLLGRIRERVECPACRWTGQKPQLGPGDACPQCAATAGPRPDDDEANFLRRHREYETLTLPVIRHYQDLGLLRLTDATAPIDTVSSRILHSVIAS